MASRIQKTHPLVAAPVRTGPWSEPLAITGLGMATSLGRGVQACAAARAAMSRVTTLDDELWDPEAAELVPATGCPVPSARGFSGVGRLATLAADALADDFGREHPDPERTGLFVGIGSGWHFDARDERAAEQDAEDSRVDPSPRRQPSSDAEQYTAALTRGLVPALRRIASFPAARAQVFAGDAPGFVNAVEAARAALASGYVDRCLVGGVDSYVETDHLEAFRVLGILKGPEAPTGILPGEGAAFVQVETVASARRRGARVVALLRGVGIGVTDDAREGGLVQAVGAALGGARTGVGLVVTDLDGTTDRAAGWGMALVRSPGLRDAAEWIPAMSFGSVGAAAGPLAAGLIVRGFERRYAPPGDALAWLWGERGVRAAFRMSRPT